jgi:broad specificity phosphatase PhoE
LKEITMERLPTKPMDFVLVRHGESEANVVQHAEKHGEDHHALEGIYERSDFMHPLTQRGIEQAKVTGQWLRDTGMAPEDFDERYVSTFTRTMETAAYLGGVATLWLPETRLIERDWGMYGATPMSIRTKQYAETERRREQSTFYTRYDGGESIPDVVGRVRDFISTLDREMTDKKVLAVTHGELMWAARFVLERMLPYEWQALDKDKAMRIGNCAVLWYSRQNPEDPNDISPTMSTGWRRIVDPNEPEKSPYGGEWVKLPGKRRLSGAELLELVGETPRLIGVEAESAE